MSIEQCDFEIRHIPAVPQRQRQRTVVVSIGHSYAYVYDYDDGSS